MYGNAIEWLLEQPAGTVAIAQLNSTYRQPEAAVGLRPGDLTSIPAERTKRLDDGLSSTIDRLQRAGHTILLVQAAPDFTYPVKFNPLECTLAELQSNSCNARMPLRVADAVQRIERSSLRTIAAKTGSGVWDPRSFFCADGECRTYRYGVNLYRDALHISVEASQMLAPSLAEALDRVPPAAVGRES
jgi:hypothetical protein